MEVGMCVGIIMDLKKIFCIEDLQRQLAIGE